MLLYLTSTENFVFIYDRERLRSESRPVDAGQILRNAGFRSEPTGRVLRSLYRTNRQLAVLGDLFTDTSLYPIGPEQGPTDWSLHLDLRDFARTEQFENPKVITCPEAAKPPECDLDHPGEPLEAGMSVECKSVGRQFIEVQFGIRERGPGSLFASPDYLRWLRDRLVACVESFVGLPGFEFGFRVYLSKDHSGSEGEIAYREWFSECFDGDRFSLRRLIHHGWLSAYAIAAGGSTLLHYGREVFDTCPAWRVGHPSAESVSVFFDNVTPRLRLDDPGKVQYIREALAHLRANLKD